VRPDGFNFKECVFISNEKHLQLRNGTLQRDDLIITTRGTIGNVALYDAIVPYNVVRINSGMLILRKKSIDFVGKYFKFLIMSSLFKDQINTKITGTAQPQLPAGILKTFVIPFPSIEEQQEIVQRVEALLAQADALEAQYESLKAKIEKLPQALLAKAFRGALVPQDPTDEPASVLLQKIKAEAAKGGKKKEKNGQIKLAF
jgi:type I restriction enzyme S subunit